LIAKLHLAFWYVQEPASSRFASGRESPTFDHRFSYS
jgi:hypothetical protein